MVQLLSAALSIGYVGSVYILPGGRVPTEDIGVVIRRIIGVTVFTIVTTFNIGVNPSQWILNLQLSDALKSILVLQVLYANEHLSNGIHYIGLKSLKDKINAVKVLIVGPVTEELVYRGIIVSLYRDAGYSNSRILIENFVYFGVAHLHHGIMRWFRGDVSPKIVFGQSFFQFVISSLFGTYSCWLLLQTRSIWPSIISHILCNLYGPPTIRGNLKYLTSSVICIIAWMYSLKYM